LLEKLADEYAGRFLLGKVNTDENPYLAQQFGVSGIPFVVAIADQRVCGRFSGYIPEPQLREFLDRVCPSPATMKAIAGEKLEASDPAAARTLYAEALALDPKEPLANAGMAQFCLQDGAMEEAQRHAKLVAIGQPGFEKAQSVLSQLEFRQAEEKGGDIAALRGRCERNPDDLAARVELGKALAAEGQFREALETLLGVVQNDRQFGAEHAKEVMVKIFGVVGQQSELANEYRSKLASALY
jgi:putative thioredoxin